MGIVYVACVEVFSVAEDRYPEQWTDRARFELFKNSDFGAAIHEHGIKHWPKDASIPEWRRTEECIDQGLYYIEGGAKLEEAIKSMEDKYRSEEEEPPSKCPRAMLAYVDALEKQGEKVRILFWEE